MAAPLHLSIELDRPDATYQLGDPVAGTLRVRADDDVEVRRLLVEPGFRVQSRGKDSTGGPDATDILPGGGHFKAGEARDFDFEVELPFQPPPYDGKNFSVRWHMGARADIAWRRDPTADPVPLDVVVGPASETAPYERWVGAIEYDLEQEEAAMSFLQRLKEGSCALKAAAGCFLPMALFGFVAFAFGALSVAFGEPLWDLLRGGGGAMLPFLILWWLSGRLSGKKAVGEVDIEVDPQEVRPGEAVHCRVVFKPTRRITMDRATITLQARERYDVRSSSRGSSSSSSTHTRWDTLHADEREAAGQQEVAKGETLEWEASFQLADPVPYSLEADSAGLRWSIKVHVAATLRRDLIREKPVVVRP